MLDEEDLLELLVVVGVLDETGLLELLVVVVVLDETGLLELLVVVVVLDVAGALELLKAVLEETSISLSSDELDTSPTAILGEGLFIILGSKTIANTNAAQATLAADAIAIIILSFLRLLASPSDTGPKVFTT